MEKKRTFKDRFDEIRSLQMEDGNACMTYAYDIMEKALDVYANVLRLNIMNKKGGK